MTFDKIISLARLFDLGRSLAWYTERGEAEVVLKASDRTARNMLSKRTAAGHLTSALQKIPVGLAFGSDYREWLFPNFFSDGDYSLIGLWVQGVTIDRNFFHGQRDFN